MLAFDQQNVAVTVSHQRSGCCAALCSYMLCAVLCPAVCCAVLWHRDLRRRGLLGPFVHLHLAADACYIRYGVCLREGGGCHGGRSLCFLAVLCVDVWCMEWSQVGDPLMPSSAQQVYCCSMVVQGLGLSGQRVLQLVQPAGHSRWIRTPSEHHC